MCPLDIDTSASSSNKQIFFGNHTTLTSQQGKVQQVYIKNMSRHNILLTQ